MTFVYLIQLSEKYRTAANWAPHDHTVVAQHFSFLKDLYGNGTVSFVGKTGLSVDHPHNTGIAFFEADSLEHAELLMQQDPAVQSGIMQLRVLPFELILPYKNQ